MCGSSLFVLYCAVLPADGNTAQWLSSDTECQWIKNIDKIQRNVKNELCHDERLPYTQTTKYNKKVKRLHKVYEKN
jgi:hypothetical protein